MQYVRGGVRVTRWTVRRKGVMCDVVWCMEDRGVRRKGVMCDVTNRLEEIFILPQLCDV